MNVIIFKNSNKPQYIDVNGFDDIASKLECEYIELLNVFIGDRRYMLLVDEEGRLKENYVSGLLKSHYSNTFLLGHIIITNENDTIEEEDYGYIKKHLDYRGGLPVFYAQAK